MLMAVMVVVAARVQMKQLAKAQKKRTSNLLAICSLAILHRVLGSCLAAIQAIVQGSGTTAASVVVA